MQKSILVCVFLASLVIASIHVACAQQITEDKTRVTVNKEISGNLLSPQLVYTITTRPVQQYDFVLALDSSGSVGIAGDHDVSGLIKWAYRASEDGSEHGLEEAAVVDAIPKFLEAIPKDHPHAKFNISIISWDDDIDFAYSSFDNTDPANATLVPIETAINDSTELLKYYHCQESNGTDFSSAISASLSILEANKNRPNGYLRNKRFIIMVTGKSEFKRCNPELLKRAEKYGIYVVGIDVPVKQSELRQYLIEDLAENDKSRYKFISADSESIQKSLNESLTEALNDVLDNAINAPVAHNVELVESLYGYLNPRESSFKVMGDNGSPLKSTLINKRINSDGTTTLTFGLPDLLPDSKIRVSLDTTLTINSLPVSVTDERVPVKYADAPATSTPVSSLNYYWFNSDQDRISIKLPAGHLPAT